MSAFEAIVLGLVQGLTEFLPISSTAHLRIVPALAGWDDPGAGFTAVIQLGTMAAVLIFFRATWGASASAWLRELRDPCGARPRRAASAGTSSSGRSRSRSSGCAFQDQIEDGARNLYLIGSR